MPNKGQVIILALDNVKKKRKNNMMKEKIPMGDMEDMSDKEHQRMLKFMPEEMGDKFNELDMGKSMKLTVFGRVAKRDGKSGMMMVDAIMPHKDENLKDSESRIIPRPSA